MRLTAQNHATPFKAVHIADTGICAGTSIMTLDGETSVEHLQPGDRVITRDGGAAILRKITRHKAKVRPVVIKAGSLGHTRPDRDMTVTPATHIHIRDWRAPVLFGAASANVEAYRLADGEFVAQKSWRLMEVFELGFDADHIVYAGGVEILVQAA